MSATAAMAPASATASTSSGRWSPPSAVRRPWTSRSMTGFTTSTHDTKRSEDVRARINVLSEIPGEWLARVRVWQNLNRRHRVVVDGQAVPGPNDEYLIYQTLVGAWPISVDRLQAYLLKAIH